MTNCSQERVAGGPGGRRGAGGAAAALLLVALVAGCERPAPGPAPNVLLVTLDTTRADHLGVYGYELPTSPHLDALGREAVVYDRAYSTSSWTLPAHASLFTGRYPRSHGARHDPKGSLVLAEAIEAPSAIRARRLTDDAATLAEVLAEAGYDTGAVVAGPWLLRVFGLARGFAHYDDDEVTSDLGRNAGEVTDAALSWLAQRPGSDEGRPFFLFLNYFDPHAPYLPPGRWRYSFLPRETTIRLLHPPHARALYDAEILYMDMELGRLFDALREAGSWERTLVVVTSDHGELLGEHDTWGHERFLWEPLVRVPLLWKPPGASRPGRRVGDAVSLVDVMPMILGAAGVPLPADVQGEVPPARRRPLLAEVSPPSADTATGNWRARWDGERKVLRRDEDAPLLFDVVADPGETRDLAPAAPAQARRAAQALDEAFAALPPAPPEASPTHVDPATWEALRAMGYVQGGPSPPEAPDAPDAPEAPDARVP